MPFHLPIDLHLDSCTTPNGRMHPLTSARTEQVPCYVSAKYNWPMPLPPLPDLRFALRGLLDQVPRGRVTTFGRLADALGDVVAARWVADFLWNDRSASDWP